MALVTEGSVLCGYNNQKARRRNAYDMTILRVHQTLGMKGLSTTSPCKLSLQWSSHFHATPDSVEARVMDTPDNSCLPVSSGSETLAYHHRL